MAKRTLKYKINFFFMKKKSAQKKRNIFHFRIYGVNVNIYLGT